MAHAKRRCKSTLTSGRKVCTRGEVDCLASEHGITKWITWNHDLATGFCGVKERPVVVWCSVQKGSIRNFVCGSGLLGLFRAKIHKAFAAN
jgi:hypothetical protein